MNDRLSDTEINSLIAGETDADPNLGDLPARIRTSSEWVADSAVQNAHVLEAVAAVSTPAVGTPTVVGNLSPSMTRRQRMFGKIMANRLTRVLAAAMATLLATSGIAWAATGDDPVKQVSSVVEHVFNGNNDEGDVEGNFEYEVDDSDDSLVDDTEDGAVDDTDDAAVDQIDESEVDDDNQGTVDDDDESEIDDDDQGTVDDDDESEIDDDDQGTVDDDDDEGHGGSGSGDSDDDDEGHGGGSDEHGDD
jgi:hypothetical protein